VAANADCVCGAAELAMAQAAERTPMIDATNNAALQPTIRHMIDYSTYVL
jgi:hypothetical protein